MKIFAGGLNPPKWRMLSDNAKMKLSEYMAQEAEIFVGVGRSTAYQIQCFLSNHKYKKVTVCVTHGEKCKNLGNWPMYYIGRHSYELDGFINTMDRAFIIWDQDDKDAFLTILEYALINKPVDVLLVKNEEIYTIASAEEIRSILPPLPDDWISGNKMLPEPIYREILGICMPSEDMRKYLEENPVPKENVLQLILGAPVSLEKKRDICRRLSKMDHLFHEVLEKCMQDSQAKSKSSSVESAYREIANNLFSKHQKEFALALESLKLKPGDLVTLDCRPYAPLRAGLLLTESDILYRDETGRWRTCSCRHGYQKGTYNRNLSPLYHITAFDGELLQEEWLLKTVQKYLDGNEERGKKMWNEKKRTLCDLVNVSDADLIRYMAKHGFEISSEEKAILEKADTIIKYEKEHEIHRVS